MEDDPHSNLQLELVDDMDAVQEVVEIGNSEDGDDQEAVEPELEPSLLDDYGARPPPDSDPPAVAARLDKYDETIEAVVRAGSSSNLSESESSAPANGDKPLNKAIVQPRKKAPRESESEFKVPFQYSGQTFNVQSQKLILNVLHFLKEHKRDHFLESVKTPQEKAARVLNISPSVIGKIRKSLKFGRLEQPGKTRRIGKRILDTVSVEDEEVIRSIVKELTETNRNPSIPVLLAEARKRIKFEGSRTSFRRILKRMGCRYVKVDKKMVMVDTRTRFDRKTPGRQKSKNSKKPDSTSQSQAFPGISSSSIQEQIQGDAQYHQEIQFEHRDNEDEHESEFQTTGSIEHPDARIQLLQRLNEHSAAGMILGGDEPQVVFQVEGQHYCFELLPAQEDS